MSNNGISVFLDLMPPHLTVVAPTTITKGDNFSILIVGDERLGCECSGGICNCGCQQIYLTDSVGGTYKLGTTVVNNTCQGTFPSNLLNAGLATISIRITDDVGNLSEIYKTVINIVAPDIPEEDDDVGEILYPIEWDAPEIPDVISSKKIQKISHIMANIVSVFEPYFLSFFEDGYFKTTYIKTQAEFSEFKAFMRDYHKKNKKPILIINPENIEIADDGFYTSTLNRMNDIDPSSDQFTMKMMYSQPIIEADRFGLAFRPNRYRCRIDVMMVEDSLNHQLDLYNHLITQFRQQTRYSLEKKFLNLIPMAFIVNAANLYKMDYKSQEFIDFLNHNSNYPIIRRLRTDGQYMFYMVQDVTIMVNKPDLPSKDSVDKKNMIESAARVADYFVFEVDIPSEFIFMVPSKSQSQLIPKISDPEDVFYTSPILSDSDLPKEYGDYTMTNKIDLMVINDEDNSLSITNTVNTFDPELGSIIKTYVDNSIDISTLVQFKLYDNKDSSAVEFTIDKDTLSITYPDFRTTYVLAMYVNFRAFNIIKSSGLVKTIGTIVE